MTNPCRECKITTPGHKNIKCLDPALCPKALDVDIVETSQDRLNEIFGLNVNMTTKSPANTVQDMPEKDFWATSDIAPL